MWHYISFTARDWYEVSRNLRENRGLTEEQARRLTNALSSHFGEAAVAGFEELIAGLTCHEKDRHVLAAAICARAAVIVTFNLQDFPPDSLRPYGIEAQHPDTFLVHLFLLAPEVLMDALREQAAALRKPVIPFERVLDTLEQHVPVFVSRVRQCLQDEASADESPGSV